MLRCPRLLHRLVIWNDVIGLMAELVQVAGVNARMTEQACQADLHLLSIRLCFQTRVLCIEPIQECRIIRVKDKKTHMCCPLHWTLAILRRQEGRMSLTIAELFPKFMLTKETCHATPARCHHIGLRAVRTTLFGRRLAPCAVLALGGDAHARGPPVTAALRVMGCPESPTSPTAIRS
jgi:hypothetical protein